MVAPVTVAATAAPAADGDYATRQAFYAALNDKNYTQALAAGYTYLAAHPTDDAFALDVAYAELAAGKRDAAVARLTNLASSTNTAVAQAASKQLAALSSGGNAHPAAGSPWDRGYVYGYGDYESRFADIFSGINARYDFTKGGVRPYAALNLTYDTRSGAPGASQIFNDDAAVFSAGLRAPLGKNEYGYLFALGGWSVGLRGQPDYGDVRYGIAYSRDYGTLLAPKPHTQVNFSAAVYSRYQGNAIGYLQGSHDARIAGALRGIAGFTYAADSHRLYYNNFAEGYAGLIVPVSDQINLRFTGVQGTYLPRGIDRPAPASYSGYRALLVFGSGFQ
jgi:hypothetical protein